MQQYNAQHNQRRFLPSALMRLLYFLIIIGDFMSCFTVIEDMKNDFLAQTGNDPTDIYIGINEMKTLILEVEQMGVMLTDDKRIDTDTVCGMKLHKVQDESHLQLGLEI